MSTDHPADPATRDFLLECEPFKELRRWLVDRVFACVRERRYDPDETMIHQGRPGDSLLVIIDGEARVRVRGHDGTIRTIATLTRGSVAGEMSLITQEPATADVVAATEVRALVLSAADWPRRTPS
jgi:CRP-like cAMP-binding protein